MPPATPDEAGAALDELARAKGNLCPPGTIHGKAAEGGASQNAKADRLRRGGLPRRGVEPLHPCGRRILSSPSIVTRSAGAKNIGDLRGSQLAWLGWRRPEFMDSSWTVS